MSLLSLLYSLCKCHWYTIRISFSLFHVVQQRFRDVAINGFCKIKELHPGSVCWFVFQKVSEMSLPCVLNSWALTGAIIRSFVKPQKPSACKDFSFSGSFPKLQLLTYKGKKVLNLYSGIHRRIWWSKPESIVKCNFWKTI